MLACYYSYPLNARARPMPTVHLVLYFPRPRYEYSLHVQKNYEALGPQNVPRGASLSAIQSLGSWQRARGDLIFLSAALKLMVWVWLWNARTYASIRHSTYGWWFHTHSSPHGTRGVWRTNLQCEVYQTLPPSCEGAGTQTSPLSGLIFCTDCCPLAWGHAGCPMSGVE